MKQKLIWLLLIILSPMYSNATDNSYNEKELKKILEALGEPVKTNVEKRAVVSNIAVVDSEIKEVENLNLIEKEIQVQEQVQEQEQVQTLFSDSEDVPNIIEEEFETLSIESEMTSFTREDNTQFSKNNEVKTNDHVYLLNIPKNTKIFNNEDIYIYPYRTAIIFDDGKVISSIPLKFNDETTFCYFIVEESGDVRRFKANSNLDNDKLITITGNISDSGKFKSHINENKIVHKHTTELQLDHEHIKTIKCISTESEKPLTIEDFNRETGNRFIFNFPPIVDI